MERENLSGGKRWTKVIFAILAWLFFIGIIVQVFLAGLALFADVGHWGYHESFVHFIEFIPIVMLVLSFFIKMTKSMRLQCLMLYIMILLQYITANLSGVVPYISALHPIIALLLFWRALVMVIESNKRLKNN